MPFFFGAFFFFFFVARESKMRSLPADCNFVSMTSKVMFKQNKKEGTKKASGGNSNLTFRFLDDIIDFTNKRLMVGR